MALERKNIDDRREKELKRFQEKSEDESVRMEGERRRKLRRKKN